MVTTFTARVSNPRVEPMGTTTPSTQLDAKACTLTFDRTWVPHVQGTLTVRRMSGAAVNAADPRTGQAVKFTLAHTYGTEATVNLPVALWLRSRSMDVRLDETVLSFASLEAVMMDADAGGTAYGQATTDVQIITDALATMRWDATAAYPVTTTPTTLGGLAPASIAAADAGWDIPTSAWDAAQGPIEAKGYWLRGDELGRTLYRSTASYSADTTQKFISGSTRVLNVVDTVTRDSDQWADQVWIDYAGGGLDYGAVGGTRPHKTYRTSRKRRKPGAGAAAAMAARMNARGRQLVVEAIADLTCRPNQTYRIRYGGYDWIGTVQAVTFRWPDGLMTMTLNI